MKNQSRSQVEFVVLMAALMSIVALSIDAVLPALPEIGSFLNVGDTSDNPKVITFIFLGLGFGQLLFGPLSDSFGRKPIVYIGFIVFIIASVICVTTKSFEMMLFGRILQGIGLASPRTMCIAMVRDSYSGDYMAKILSFVVMIFILVPIIAPSLGQFLMQQYHWKSIFMFNLGFGVLVMLWFWLRQPETLKDKHRIKYRLAIFKTGTIAFFKIKPAVIYTILSGLITGSFMVYLSTSQRIFEQQYNMAEEFPLIFASIAVSVGLSTFLNSQLVVRFGMRRIVHTAMLSFVIIALVFVIMFSSGGNPSIEVLIGFFALQFLTIGFIFGNLRALAMEPMGHIAGIGSALNGFISTVMAVPIADYIGKFVTDSVTPLFIGFLVCGLISLALFYSITSRVSRLLKRA
ncbi:DHA1 family bicyclomycin/chloramphenicol resistance-like MFS transporter [Winogradskyella wandonensis]|uniref:DHA1 family bicyclomycin/chloramphenicol resistance-like MFS transporter n=1 Tax=Winogradskyella wandonensis TaxID=1442586 RepID=A0A4R1KIV7_9FLAO|nr:multidrug effflux MFS transporter [Winogradskyella wandonensis]TCK64778.1 DHA1 family bicyclomycin/chloramphenicol resistance-like MFS transporter [Winogradskyella wandonensis]